MHALARALPARYKRLEWLDLREGKLPNPDVEYPDLGEPAAFACSNRICSFPSFNAEELQATVKQMAKLKPSRGVVTELKSRCATQRRLCIGIRPNRLKPQRFLTATGSHA